MDLRSDFIFKYVFGKKAHKDLLLDFLNSVFEGRKVICDVRLSPTEHLGRKKGTRKVLFDLLCTSDEGEQFLVEMQRDRQDFFSGRALYYAQRIGSEQVPVGKKGDSYQLRDVYVIAITDFILRDDAGLPLHQGEDYVSVYNLRRTGTGELHPENIELLYIELPRFTKVEKELQTRLEKWLYLFKQLVRLQDPIFQDDLIFQKLFQITQINKLSKEDRMLIDHERDWRNKAKVWKREGLEQGMEIKELAFVRALISDTDFDNRKIASLAAVTEAFVKKVREEFNPQPHPVPSAASPLSS